MYERMLVAVDHSEVTERVLAAARELALMSKGEVWVLHLREREVIPGLGLVPTESDEEATSKVESCRRGADRGGDRCPRRSGDTIFGHAARYIVEDAKEHDADVIVMGSKGRSLIWPGWSSAAPRTR